MFIKSGIYPKKELTEQIPPVAVGELQEKVKSCAYQNPQTTTRWPFHNTLFGRYAFINPVACQLTPNSGGSMMWVCLFTKCPGSLVRVHSIMDSMKYQGILHQN